MGKMWFIFRFIFKILPLLVEGMIAAEAAWPQAKLGAFKLELMRQTVQDIYDEDGDGKVDFDTLWPYVVRWIGRIVEQFNEEGWPEPQVKT